MICTVEKCGKRVNARGLCVTHYAQWTRGKPVASRPLRRRPESGIDWSWLDHNSVIIGKCRIWLGALDQNGYGKVRVDGSAKYVHRVGYELINGVVPDGLDLDHLCRVPCCLNPDHLEAVSRRENALRGVGICATNSKKTHCKNGHLLGGDNLRPCPVGHRRCRACYEAHKARMRAKNAK